MALIHWWPLNGDTKDYGSGNLALIGQGSIGFTNSGKIGKGASFTSDSQNLKATDLSTLHSFTNYTLCCWVYLTATATNHSTAFLSSGDWNVAAKQVAFGLYNYSSGYQYLLVPNGSAWSGSIQLANKIQPNVWHHYAITYDGTTTKGYIDGVYVGQRNGGGISSTNVSYYYLGAATYYAGFTMKGTMNDFRIYDHALSAKEVKEISKGLVLHYNFEDPWIEPTTNLITSINGSTLLKKAGNGIDVQTASGDAACGLVLSTTAVAGNTYTLSFDVSGMGSSDRCSFGLWFSGGVGLKYTTAIYNGHNVIKCTNFPADRTSLTFDDSGRSNTNIIHIRNFQFEAKDHATPYVVGSRTVGKVYDSSGYGYNGTLSNSNVEIVGNAPIGKYSIKLNPTSITHKRPVEGGTNQEWTINAWVYPTATTATTQLNNFNLGNRLYHSTGGNGLLYLNNGTNDYYRYSSEVLSTNKWTMVTFVFRNSDGRRSIYYNAVQKDGSGPNRTSTPSGISDTVTSFANLSGYVADYKIYATALSDADILAEYNRKAAIDKSGHIFTGEFIETGTSPKINKNNTITVEELTETANSNAKLFEDSIVSSEFYEL